MDMIGSRASIPVRKARIQGDAIERRATIAAHYATMVEVDSRIQGLDPLRMDSFLARDLPRLNDSADVPGLKSAATELGVSPSAVESFSYEEAAAATRDLGMVASSLVRFGVSVSEFSDLESTLLKLSKTTNEVPADTVYSYGTRNPAGNRMRRFTNEDGEVIFINSFKSGMMPLPMLLANLETLQTTPLSDPSYGTFLQEAKGMFESMVMAMTEVRKNITPEFFTNQLRPYFEPKTVGGHLYHAPGGAQMPMIIIDQLLWSGRFSTPMYESYFADNLQYQPPFLQRRSVEIRKELPLVQSIMLQSNGMTKEERASLSVTLKPLKDLLEGMEQFRRIHHKVAEDNFVKRPYGSVGSGGYALDILKLLLSKTTEAKNDVLNLIRCEE